MCPYFATHATNIIAASDNPPLSGTNGSKHIMTDHKLVVINGSTHDGDDGALMRPELLDADHDFVYSHRIN